MDWVTKYHITYPPNTHSPLSLSQLSLGAWCPFCAPAGGHIPWLQAPAWEALPGGPRIAEGLNVLVYPPFPLLYNGSMLHYLCGRAGQGSTDGVNTSNASLLF